ncbi:ImmA/IrrE family metallo-endopeptidase [Cytobacillus oceanisediminis]|uniref:ImmA/IrrE family metallo-endopeptidase n=1 Tax=Cytobacillus oceanisediminis TaxID=665099 RepID=UPI001C232DAD|nr:ImmA/IrrE family metallo-endopeptidase [Cytobacillus oceanisediminis]MBU8768675.1 ImmA/IrrE family metallo-endopeptidase [Cytobacillus oceanisediminis]MBY0157309.1 ImmA/IrrE family metallo-endopeptidase [Cytobacillus firmus]MCM3395929.1 ImmA/IrrE family metallo-endopeptidase [Cytobacillus oceanisediminis]USK46244.1 ImmA/IrrE family metallo-endopeptidase [Cytobacillus oceanisediminis]
MNWIKQAAQDTINKYKTNDPFELASFKNINIIEWDLHQEIKGFYKYDKRNKYIVINSNLEKVQQKFVCAHELGHSVLHPRVNTPFLRENTLFLTSRIEVEANTFAVELLLPDDVLQENSQSTIFELASLQGVPKEIVHLKKF